jgi:hypothetical protein
MFCFLINFRRLGSNPGSVKCFVSGLAIIYIIGVMKRMTVCMLQVLKEWTEMDELRHFVRLLIFIVCEFMNGKWDMKSKHDSRWNQWQNNTSDFKNCFNYAVKYDSFDSFVLHPTAYISLLIEKTTFRNSTGWDMTYLVAYISLNTWWWPARGRNMSCSWRIKINELRKVVFSINRSMIQFERGKTVRQGSSSSCSL